MRFYENPEKTSENRMPQRAYYIPQGVGAYTLLNGTWRFRYYSRDVDMEQEIARWDALDVPSCWQSRGYENPTPEEPVAYTQVENGETDKVFLARDPELIGKLHELTEIKLIFDEQNVVVGLA